MKKFLLLLVALIITFSCCSCGQKEIEKKTDLPPAEDIMDFTKYSQSVYLKPFWYTREIYNETVMFVGENDSAKLMYEPEQILAVTNYGLSTMYVENKDYEIENGVIKRTANSSIPYWKIDEYYKTVPDSYTIAVDKSAVKETLTGDRYLKYGETDTFTKKQIAVSYITNKAWEGPVPKGKSEKFSKSLLKIKNGQKIKILFYGDSITTGCNASGSDKGGNVAPYMPSFDKMTCDYLTNKYKCEIELVNTAVGGKNVSWGASNLQERVLSYSPDLVFVGFGMNDGKKQLNAYYNETKEIIDGIHESLPDTEIVLLATMLPNYEADSNWNANQKYFDAELLKLEEKYDFVGVANVTEMHKTMFDAGKRYRDLTGNNINHPNDFVVRLYAQVILKTLLGQDFIADGV